MADIQFRFLKDMLVLSEPVWTGLKRLGLNVERDGELTLLLEPEVFEEAYQLDVLAGAQCLVTPTAALTPARLAHTRLENRATELAHAALQVVQAQNPQHILVELGPCGLPLDVASKASLNENCDQYKRAAMLFDDEEFDAFFLNGFVRVADLKCALIGLRKVTDAPVFASVDIDAEGALPNGEPLLDAAAVMAEYGAQVIGFSTAASQDTAAQFAQMLRNQYALPLLAQLEVCKKQLEQELEVLGLADFEVDIEAPVINGPYADAEDMVDAADILRAAGVQFLRATGDATPAYTGALVAATDDLDMVLPLDIARTAKEDGAEPIEDAAARLRAKVNRAIGQ